MTTSVTVHLTGGDDPLVIDISASTNEQVRDFAAEISRKGFNHNVDGVWRFYPAHRIKLIEVPMEIPPGYTITIES